MLSLSIVLYNTSTRDIERLINSLAYVKSSYTLFLVDNSGTDRLKHYFDKIKNAVYIHNPSNPGFGAAHNIAIKKSIDAGFLYHFVINPDVFFEEDVITPMIDYMNSNKKVGMMMPRILNIDGSHQNLPKLLPSPFSILLRKLKKPSFLYNPFIKNYELRFVENNTIYDAPILSGCFTLFRLDYIKEIGLYDDRFFMYFEDWDISRRMHTRYKTLYFPQVSVYHGYESGANKNSKLFKIFIISAYKYFSKWGWFFDRNRNLINKKALSQFK